MKARLPVHVDSDDGVIVTTALSKRYGRVMALDGVDIRVPEGAVYVLVGANGAGKTTTMRVLMNMERPDGGSAHVMGLKTAEYGPEVRAQIGYVPEHHDIAPAAVTCARLLRHAGVYFPTWDAEYAASLSEALALPLDRRVGGLSKGERRRLQLVLALAHRPPVLLLDEPTDGLDPLARNRVLSLLAGHLADAPATVLISTHHVHQVESLADHVGVLHAGRLVAQLPREELQRTVRRYRIELPTGWEPPSDLSGPSPRSRGMGREVQWTLIGEEREVSARLAGSGARVRDVSALPLEEAALAILEEEVSR